MRVLVCGGRDFRDKEKLFEALDFWHQRLRFTLLIQGGQVSTDPSQAKAPWSDRDKWGADYFAKLWAQARGVPMVEEAVSKEDWKTNGPAAGPMRNTLMLRKHKPQVVISMPGGRGTTDMLRQARDARVKCIEVA